MAGLGYLAKTIMFPVGFAFWPFFFSGRLSRRRTVGVLISTVMFLLVCSPFILALLNAKG